MFEGLGYGIGVTIVDIGDGVCLHSSPPESVSEQLQSGHNAWMTRTKGGMNPLEDLLLSSYLVGSLEEMDLESGLD